MDRPQNSTSLGRLYVAKVVPCRCHIHRTGSMRAESWDDMYRCKGLKLLLRLRRVLAFLRACCSESGSPTQLMHGSSIRLIENKLCNFV